VGLTGGIGSGKSTVAALFSARGVTVIDADQVARQVTRPGTSALTTIAGHFGNRVLTGDGELDRAYLGRKVFADPGARKWLESLLHPLIRENMDRLVAECGDAFCILEIPLLVESGRAAEMDRIIVVQCPRESRIRRVVESRGMSREQVVSIMAQQATDEDRLAIADYVVHNDGDRDQLQPRVEAVLEALRREFA
jgi:dephospho-CoA kinase